MTDFFWRLFLISFCCALTFLGGYKLHSRIEERNLLEERMRILAMKKKHLEKAVKEKVLWLSVKSEHGPHEIARELTELPLCESAYGKLIQTAFHPFLKDEKGLTSLLDRLEDNRIKLQKLKDEYHLVRPVYMGRKDLEKMIEIIENKGTFSPVEIKQLDFKKESLLGGELWRVDRLVFGLVDADGALL